MKILVYGAGVLGCNLARNLLRAGKDVTLLARGNWAAEIKQNGLRIKDKFSLRTSVSRIPVVTELAPDAKYDVIFVVLRYTQLDSVLDTLRANRTKNIVFVGNNVQARALAAALPEASAEAAGAAEEAVEAAVLVEEPPHAARAPAALSAPTAFRKERRENVKDIIVPPRMYKYNFAILLKKHYL